MLSTSRLETTEENIADAYYIWYKPCSQILLPKRPINIYRTEKGGYCKILGGGVGGSNGFQGERRGHQSSRWECKGWIIETLLPVRGDH